MSEPRSHERAQERGDAPDPRSSDAKTLLTRSLASEPEAMGPGRLPVARTLSLASADTSVGEAEQHSLIGRTLSFDASGEIALDSEHTPPPAASHGVDSTEIDALTRYEILAELGRGGMGIVYAAHDRKLDRQVAIKKLRSESEPRLRRRLLSEAKIMAKLAHPNIVPIYEIGELDDSTFIVMEYVEGVTLRRWLSDAPRSIAQILEVFVAAGRGLGAVHAKGLVHRDFKPDNVMLGVDGRPRVTDFGLARAALGTEQTPTTRGADTPRPGGSAVLTRSGTILGTPAYMAPEQLRGERADAAGDQFGFCVALYEAIYGERPFAGRSLDELASAIERRELRQPPLANAPPNWLRALLLRGLAPEPSQRFASMRELLDELTAHPGEELEAAAELEASGAAMQIDHEPSSEREHPAAVETPAPPAPQARRWLPWIVGFGLLALLAGDYAWLRCGADEPEVPDTPSRRAMEPTLAAAERAARECSAKHPETPMLHTAKVRLEVGPDGRVRSATVLPPAEGTPRGRCAADSISAQRFPASRDGITTTVTLPLEP
jgi:serine/threonine protein kinase